MNILDAINDLKKFYMIEPTTDNENQSISQNMKENWKFVHVFPNSKDSSNINSQSYDLINIKKEPDDNKCLKYYYEEPITQPLQTKTNHADWYDVNKVIKQESIKVEIKSEIENGPTSIIHKRQTTMDKYLIKKEVKEENNCFICNKVISKTDIENHCCNDYPKEKFFYNVYDNEYSSKNEFHNLEYFYPSINDQEILSRMK